jgi:Ni/Fe-hydrogenase subunit HybB-like protein
MLAVYLTMKVMDAHNRGIFGLLTVPRYETYLYWFEMAVGVLIPMVLLSFSAIRRSQTGLFMSSTMIILGFVLNRMNITITGMEASAGQSYLPSWMELSITLAIVTLGFIGFSLAAKHLPVYGHEAEAHTAETKPLQEAWIDDLVLVSQDSRS